MSRRESEERILEAFERVLVSSEQPGINTVAREAGLDKVLIYRYFTSWDGLLEAFASRVNIWRAVREALEAGLLDRRWLTAEEAAIAVFSLYQDRVSASELFQQVLIWEINNPASPLTRASEQERDREGGRVIELLSSHFPEDLSRVDAAALGAFFVGAITFLAMKGSRSAPFNGIDFTQPQGWDRLRVFWTRMIRALLEETHYRGYQP